MLHSALKCCTSCRAVRPLMEFKADARNQDGRAARCKRCHAFKERARVPARNSAEELSDGYIARLCGFRLRDAPPDLLSMKREQLLLQRLSLVVQHAAHQPTGSNHEGIAEHPGI